MNKAYISFKYTLDFILACVALVVLAPVFAAIAIAIKAEDGENVIFRQRRTGKDGKKFDCFKFRSMKRTDVVFDRQQPVIGKDNANLTKVGAFIRKFKLDELPQLLNVVRGEMSLIAPRPLLPVYDADYEDWETVKFMMRPGLTGLGQVCGNGFLDMRERKYYDAYYAVHLSFGLDVKIALKTIGVIFRGEQKYLRHVSEHEYNLLKRQIRQRYTVPPETLARLRPTARKN